VADISANAVLRVKVVNYINTYYVYSDGNMALVNGYKARNLSKSSPLSTYLTSLSEKMIS